MEHAGSAGKGAVFGMHIRKNADGDRVVALAGNPNVGKSTVFNALTGMKQHTGNWPGKTVESAQGHFAADGHGYTLVDLPGTYSLLSHSAEEEVARNFICFGESDAVVVVCDATCLERNLNLVLQIIEITPRTVVCVNLMDEARRKKIRLDLPLLSRRLGVPVVGITAREKKGLRPLTRQLDGMVEKAAPEKPYRVKYAPALERALALLEQAAAEKARGRLSSRWLALRLLEADETLLSQLGEYLGEELSADASLQESLSRAREALAQGGIESAEQLKDSIVTALVSSAEELCADAVTYADRQYARRDRRVDKIVTSALTGYPLMLALLALVFWLTITGANYPSQLLSQALFALQDRLSALFAYMSAPDWLHGVLVLGVYRTVAWVVSVMLPPMAIFFPLFTLLEDAGYLPRIAYNLDKPFQRCRACGKQALCMCMGFGCNAVGVVGCRIIDSPRERLLAILTNNFVPCNGRFPTLIAILTVFFVGTAGGAFASLLSALLLTAVIVLAVATTFAVTRLLSGTVLKGVPSSFTLELPPYRTPQLGKVLVRSVLDRTLFVLGRAAAVAAPAGLIIYLAANVYIGELSLLSHCAAFLDPLAQVMGLDGVILLAFILGFPANEIVIPIIIMAYTAQGSLIEFESLAQLRALFVENGWTWRTAICTVLFSLNHWPCSTTLLTIKKETGSLKWTALAAALPTAVGMALCIAFNLLSGIMV